MIRMLRACAVVTFVMALTSATAFAAAAPHVGGHDERRGTHHYIYYPTKRLYFSPETQMWFWPDGDSWTSGGALPILDQQYARGGYSVYLDVERPYEAQQDVEAGYRHHKWKPYHYGDDASGNAGAPTPRHGRGAGK